MKLRSHDRYGLNPLHSRPSGRAARGSLPLSRWTERRIRSAMGWWKTWYRSSRSRTGWTIPGAT